MIHVKADRAAAELDSLGERRRHWLPHYYFDFADGGRCLRNDEGTACETAREARTKAVRALTAMAKDEPLDDDLLDYMVSVRDDFGHVVYRATLSLAGEWPTNRN